VQVFEPKMGLFQKLAPERPKKCTFFGAKKSLFEKVTFWPKMGEKQYAVLGSKSHFLTKK